MLLTLRLVRCLSNPPLAHASGVPISFCQSDQSTFVKGNRKEATKNARESWSFLARSNKIFVLAGSSVCAEVYDAI